ncbi:hypothetical protein GCM10027615_64190 [Plantactinospora veratri]
MEAGAVPAVRAISDRLHDNVRLMTDHRRVARLVCGRCGCSPEPTRARTTVTVCGLLSSACGEPRLCTMEGVAWILLCPCVFFVLLFFAATVILWFQTKPGSR